MQVSVVLAEVAVVWEEKACGLERGGGPRNGEEGFAPGSWQL